MRSRVQVRALFTVAGALQPSVIFIDEIDSLLAARKADGALPCSSSPLFCALLQPAVPLGMVPAGRHATSRPLSVLVDARLGNPGNSWSGMPCVGVTGLVQLGGLQQHCVLHL